MKGAGKYNEICTMIREGLRAQGVVLAVINGPYGTGLSVQASQELLDKMPAALRDVADEMEKDNLERKSA